MTIVHVCDIRALDYCSSGVREFCKHHNIDYMESLKNGIDESVLLSTNDVMAYKAIEQAKKREAKRE